MAEESGRRGGVFPPQPGRIHELDNKGAIKQALWGLAGELGLMRAMEGAHRGGGRLRGDRGSVSFRRRRELGP